MRIPSPRTWTLGIGLLLVVAAPLALASGNAGDVKVKNPDGTGDQDNEPHVGCSFFIEGFNMVASSGSITFEVWPPSGHFTVVHASGAPESWTSDSTNAHGHHHFLSGPYSLPAIGDAHEGTHYKVFVSDGKHSKMKVFWTQCSTTGGCTQDCTPPGCTENCTPTPECTENCTPTTQVPFFPSLGSVALGLAGAAGSVVVALRRRP